MSPTLVLAPADVDVLADMGIAYTPPPAPTRCAGPVCLTCREFERQARALEQYRIAAGARARDG